MKKLTKIMLSVAAAAVVTAAMAVTAMAEDTQTIITGTYNNESGVVTMQDVRFSGPSQTILVYKPSEGEMTTADIAYINQIDNQTSPNGYFSTFTLESGLKPTTAGETRTFNIKIGGSDGTLQTGTLTIAGDAPATVTIKIGDIDFDKNNRINMDDVTALQEYVTKIYNDENAKVGDQYTVVSGFEGVESFKIGDIDFDKNNRINMDDVTALQEYVTKIYNDENANVSKEVVSIPITSAE